MLEAGQLAPSIPGVDSPPRLVVFLESDCPTCRLSVPYLNKLARSAQVLGVSQDSEPATRQFREQLQVEFHLILDPGLNLSRAFDPMFVPSLFVLDAKGRVERAHFGFDKNVLNEIAAQLGGPPVAPEFDGAPQTKPGCMSRHLEPAVEGDPETAAGTGGSRGIGASRMEVAEGEDLFEYCFEEFGDALPVVPPTAERVARMLGGRDPREVAARVPPCYGEATMEKIAANAVMAGCAPEMMRVLVPLVRAVCDERFNIHGVQATTHFAAPLVIVNGPVRRELGFSSGQNLFSNVARANSTLGRALQLILLNIGGARPGGIDMSALGNPGKFSSCIAENEELSPWEPLHVELGFKAEQSALTLFAAAPPQGVSEHTARDPEQVLKSISYTLATIWTYRACLAFEAVVILCPEHARTIHAAGWTKQQIRDFLFENTGVPLRVYAAGVEGSQLAANYQQIVVDGEACYRKFRAPEQIRIVVAGGTAGKFSAVLGSWMTGPRGSAMVTYPI